MFGVHHTKYGINIPYQDINDGLLRVLLRVYFVVLMILIAIVGAWACRLHVRYKVLRKERVPLTHTMGWLQGPLFARITLQMRALPGGWLGWLMLFTIILDIIGEFGVANSVTLLPVASSNVTTSGMIQGEANGYTPEPWPLYLPYTLGINSQLSSVSNARFAGISPTHHGYGIYRVVPVDIFNFMASEDDILGNWLCAQTNSGQTIIYQQTSDDEIAVDLRSKGLLDDSLGGATNRDSSGQTTATTHTTILGASTNSRGFFDVSAAVSVSELDDQGSKEMATFLCQLQIFSENTLLLDVANQLNLTFTLYTWAASIATSLTPEMYATNSYNIPTIESKLSLFLNTIFMVSGGASTVFTKNTYDQPHGILAYVTVIPYWIIMICVLVAVLSLFLVGYTFWLFLFIARHSIVYDRSNNGYHVSSKEIRDNTPVGMLDWMTHHVYEARDVEQIPKARHLKGWILSTSWHAGRRLGIVKENEHGHVDPLRTPGYTPQGTPAMVQSQTFNSSNGYFKVSVNEPTGYH